MNLLRTNRLTKLKKGKIAMETNTRLVTLCDGTGMGDMLIVFETDAPVKRLKELEKECCDMYINEPDPKIPIWSDVLFDEGYQFSVVDYQHHVTAYNSSNNWLKNHPRFKNINEHYVIENQPDVIAKAQ
jgi:hypothetical protein